MICKISHITFEALGFFKENSDLKTYTCSYRDNKNENNANLADFLFKSLLLASIILSHILRNWNNKDKDLNKVAKDFPRNGKILFYNCCFIFRIHNSSYLG